MVNDKWKYINESFDANVRLNFGSTYKTEMCNTAIFLKKTFSLLEKLRGAFALSDLNKNRWNSKYNKSYKENCINQIEKLDPL